MADTSPGRILRDLQQAQARLRKTRETIRNAREHGGDPSPVLRAAWQELSRTYQLFAEIPWDGVDDAVMLRQLAVARYASAVLVRLRRLQRGGGSTNEQDDIDVDEE
jgi:hypothetical protein